jgi:hypothetical protein
VSSVILAPRWLEPPASSPEQAALPQTVVSTSPVSSPWGYAGGHRTPGVAPSARALDGRSRGPGPTDPAQLGARPHYVGPPLDVLRVGERSSLDHYR